MSLNEVYATVSVLLGFAPPTSLPALSSSQVIYTPPGMS
jgi:renin receptor